MLYICPFCQSYFDLDDFIEDYWCCNCGNSYYECEYTSKIILQFKLDDIDYTLKITRNDSYLNNKIFIDLSFKNINILPRNEVDFLKFIKYSIYY